MPAVADLREHRARRQRPAARARRAPRAGRRTPHGLVLGGTARVVVAVLDAARRSVAAGLVHPHLQAADGRWHALWGATLDEHVDEELDALARVAPAASADAFDRDTRAFVDDLYGCAVDELARRALRAANVTHDERVAPNGRRRGAVPRGARGGRRRTLPAETGYAALERRLAAWVDGGLTRRSRAPWNLGLRLDEADGPVRESARRPGALARGGGRPDPRAAGRTAPVGGRRGLRIPARSDPRRALDRRLATIEPILADAGIALAGDPPTSVVLDTEQVRTFLRDAMPRLEAIGVPLRLPREWVSSSSRVRVNLVATGVAPSSSGLLTREAIASFDWRLAIGDVELTDEELRALAAAKEPLVRLRGSWHALRATEVERALRFLETRDRAAGVVELVRAVAGLETEEAGRRAGRRPAGRRARRSPRRSRRAALRAARRRPAGCVTTCSRSRSAVTGGCACSATSASAGSSRTTWGSGRPSRRSRPSSRNARRRERTSGRRSSSAR